MINLKHAHTAREGRLAQREAVEAGTNDDVLKYTELNCYRQGILGVPRAEDRPSITRVKLQRRIKDLARSTKCVTTVSGLTAETFEDNTQNGVAVRREDNPVPPGIVNER
jgi:hypothetical protein